eukprot:5568519-Prymnesium_polylepis.1
MGNIHTLCGTYGSPSTGGVRNTSGITVMSPPGAPGGSGEARGVPHLGQAKPQWSPRCGPRRGHKCGPTVRPRDPTAARPAERSDRSIH